MARSPLGAVLAVVCLVGLSFAAPPADPVEGLRMVLKAAGNVQERDRQLAEAAGPLRGAADLGRALMLAEWRDGDADPQVAAVDRRQYESLAGRFQQAVRAVFEHGSPANQTATADQVSRLATANLEIGRNDWVCKPLAADLARLAVHGHPAVREAAARALGRVAPEPAVALPVLRDMLTTGSVSSRGAAVEAVSYLIRVAVVRTAPGRGGSYKDLIEADCAYLPLAGVGMQDDELSIRRASVDTLTSAVAALTKVRGPLAETLPVVPILRSQGPALAHVLADPDPTVRLMARQAIEEIGRLHYHLGGGQRLKAQGTLLAMLPTILPPLAQGLSDTDVRLRRSTLAALESWGPDAEPAAPALYDALDDPDHLVRCGAARMVGKIGPVMTFPGAVPALMRLLHDSDPEFRLAAVTTLKLYGVQAAPAVARLSEMVSDQEPPPIRTAALRTLAAIGPAAKGAITDLLKKIPEKDDEMHVTAELALQSILAKEKEAAALAGKPVPK